MSGMSRSPDVTSPQELMLVPAFAALVEHMARTEFENTDLEAFVVGDQTAPAWAALHALALRPRDDPLAARALTWLNRFHPWTRHLTLRLLETWHAGDAGLVRLVLSRIDDRWEHAACLTVLESFLRRRAAAGDLTLGDEPMDPDTRERLADILEDCDPELVRPVLNELARSDGPEPGDAPREWRRPSGPRSHDARLSGRRHEPGRFGMPVVFPRAAFERAHDRVARVLRSEPRRSILISGDVGVGKTTLARALAAGLSREGWRVFETSALELNAGMSYVGELEGRIQLLLDDARRHPKTLWLVRDFHQLVWTGRSSANTTGLLEMLTPALMNRELLMLGVTHAAAADFVQSEQPNLARVLETARLDPPRDEELPAIARAWVQQRLPAEAGRWSEAMIEETVLLARHHVGAMGMPAGLIRVLECIHESGAGSSGPLTTGHLVQAISEMTGLPLDMLDEGQPLDTRELQAHFEARVIGQPDAVRVLVDRLALMKAGVASTSRPYAVLLFAGPTGTGKTELVKALATYLFGSPDRMVRVDMSELQDAGAYDRLLAAGGATAGGSLAARVRRRPFSVVLLDEFEKAHPQIWNLFLQVFDDGRLTDSRGETIDFRNTFIVLTSNLGAKLAGTDRLGFLEGQFSEREVHRAVTATFRPELVNRLDRIVVFRPLTRDAMRTILRKQIGEAFTRRGLRRREWALEMEEGALEFLLERGFTADLGARPLQRSLEQHLLAPLSRTIVEHRAPEGDQFLFVRRDGEGLVVEFVDPDAEPPSPGVEPAAATGTDRDLRAIAWEARGDSRELHAVGAAVEALERRIGDEAWSTRKAALLAEAAAPGFWERKDRFEVLGRAEFLDRVESGARSARSLLARLEGESRRRPGYPRPMIRRLAQQLILLGIASRDALDHGPRDAFLVIDGGADAATGPESTAWRDRLLEMYLDWARVRGMRAQRVEPVRADGARAAPHLLAVSGFAALDVLLPEQGLHVLEVGALGPGTRRTTARVRVAPQPVFPARGADDIAKQAAEAFRHGESAVAVVRRYRESPSPLVRDGVRGWRTGRIDRVLAGEFDIVPRDDGGDAETESGGT